MSDQIDIQVTTKADTSGFTAAEKAAQKSASVFAGLTAQEQQAAASALKLSNAAQKLATEEQKTAAAASQASTAQQRFATETERTALASNQAAVAAQRLATEEQRTAAAASQAAAAQTRAETAAFRLAKAQDQAANSAQRSAGFAKQMGDAFSSSLMGIVGPAAIAGTAVAALGAVASKANEALLWKAELDATTASINAQLKGVRDASQVYAEASRFGQEFKLTQLEQAQAIQGAIGVIRQSKAPIEDILGVLARMQVLSPEQSLQEAAVALKALAGGDTTSLVTRFEVSRDVANQMKQEIAGGADAVAVMSKFLGDVGIGMDALKAKTEGASGALKDLALQQERLNKVIAGEKGGLGLTLLEAKTNVYKGLSNALSENANMLYAAAKAQDGAYSNALARGATESEAAAAGAEAHRAVLARTTETVDAVASAITAATSVVMASTVANEQESAAVAIVAAALDEERIARGQAQVANDAYIASLGESISQQQASEIQSMRLSEIQQALADLGPAVAGGLQSAGSAADFLTARYGIAAAQAWALVQAQAAIAGTTVKLNAVQKATDREFDSAADRAAVKSAQALEANRKLLAAVAKADAPARASGGGGRAGGGAPRVSAAEQTSTKLADIERASGQKLADINEQTQEKIAAIEAKYASQRLRAIQSLNDDIARSNAGERFSQELNDFEQFGKDMSDEQRSAFAEREKAEQTYNDRVRTIQEQAKQEAVSGDADLAAERMKILEADAKRQMEIAQAAAKANIDTGGAQAEAVAQQAAEASAASKAQADTEIAIAEAKAAEKAGAMQAEKDAVIASANEQAEKVISAATEQAAKVKGASDSQKSTVIGNLQAQASAAGSWASAIESASRRANAAMRSVSGPPAGGDGGTGEGGAAEGGGGEAPGGQGMAGGPPRARRTASAGGSGGDSISGAISTLQDAARIMDAIKPFVAANKGALKILNDYKSLVNSAVGSLLAIQNLRERLVRPAPVLDPAAIEQLRADTELVVQTLLKVDFSANKKIGVLKKYLELEGAAVEILSKTVDLREKLGVPQPPINMTYVAALASEIQQVVGGVLASIPKMVQREIDNLKAYNEGSGAAIAILNNTADLAKNLAEPIPPITPDTIQRLADITRQVVLIVNTSLIQLTEAEATALARYAEAAGSAVGLLNDTADLPQALATPQPAIPPDAIRQIAEVARQVLQVVSTMLLPLTEEASLEIERYADTAGASIGLLSDVLDFRNSLAEGWGVGIYEQQIDELAKEARAIAQTLQRILVPTSEAEAAAASAYADSVGSAVQVVSDVLDFRNAMAEGWGVGIYEQQIDELAKEARAIAQTVQRILVPTSEEEAAGLSHYADSVGSAVSILSDVVGLRTDMADLAGPIPEQAIRDLAAEAAMVARIVQRVLIPTTEETAAGMGWYAESVGAAVSVISDVVGLRKDAADLAPPISEKAVIRLADDAKRIAQIVLARMVPASEEQAEAAQRYADVTGSAVSALSDTLGLSARMFTDYQSPTDAQINRVVADADRIVRGVDKAARMYSTEGLEAAQAFGEATGSILSAFKEQLLFAQAIGSGDFKIDLKNLAIFETGLSQTLAVANRLGAQAAAIPPGNIAALQSATTALTSAYDSMIKLGAVPFGNVPQLTSGLSQGMGGGQIINVYVQNPPANLNVPALIQQVKQGIAQSATSRH